MPPSEQPPDIRRALRPKTPGAFLPAPTLSQRGSNLGRKSIPPQPAMGNNRSFQSRNTGRLSFPMLAGSNSVATNPKRGYSSLSKTTTATSPRDSSGRSQPSTGARAASRARHTTRPATSLGDSDGFQVICAISEARGSCPEVGMALFNLTTNEVFLTQMGDSQFYTRTMHKLQIYKPEKILMNFNDNVASNKSTLYGIIQSELSETAVISLNRKYYSERTGREYMNQLALKSDLKALNVSTEGKFYSIASFAALMRYLELELNLSILAHSLRIRYQPPEDTMMIDLPAITSLELVQNSHDPKSKLSLLGLLDETKTKMGRRLLTSNILQPSTKRDTVLECRYDAVAELSSKEGMFHEVRKGTYTAGYTPSKSPRQALANKILALQGLAFVDLDKMLTKLVTRQPKCTLNDSEVAINNVLEVKSFVIAVSPLFEALALSRTVLLTVARGMCRPEVVQPLIEIINDIVNDDVIHASKPIDRRNQRTYAVKSGVHGLLDVARKTFKEATEDLHNEVERLKERLSLPNLEVKFEDKRKYYLLLNESDVEEQEFPGELINAVKVRGNWECQTLSMVKLNHRITDSANEVVMLSDEVIQQLLEAIRAQVPALFQICESIAMVDMLAGFAEIVTTRDYTRPELSDCLALKSARHPILDKAGCNMSGKTTYLRMIALLQIMAQVGCFVPADYASLPVMQNLFARVSTDDSIESSLSTFSMEMRDVAFVLRNINEKSLAIIDELGRGTSTRDGLAIAIAISEALIKSGAQVVFATHFQDLTKVLKDQPGVLNLHLRTETRTTEANIPHMSMLYKITTGPLVDELYGIRLARTFGFPDGFIRLAERTARELKRRQDAKKMNSASRKAVERRKLVTMLHEKMKHLEQSDLSQKALWSYMRQMQVEFVTRMERIEEGGPEMGESAETADGDDEASEASGQYSHAGGPYMSGAIPPSTGYIDDDDVYGTSTTNTHSAMGEMIRIKGENERSNDGRAGKGTMYEDGTGKDNAIDIPSDSAMGDK
ncbi:hypothetical protein MKZ38_008521 [Zalerion maritima]|uniref:DNA mismatch repair protein MSH3 n=1 Tax=Zalerion maritima TaxID=339359 RepID=A0AAD5WMN1_9PEZI|nr:hypothetical protein MKZ38_008521 [Zalerion maritima]